MEEIKFFWTPFKNKFLQSLKESILHGALKGLVQLSIYTFSALYHKLNPYNSRIPNFERDAL